MGRRRSEDVVLLFVKAPHLRDEWDYDKNDGVDPERVSSGSALSVWWKCSDGHEWKARVGTRGDRGSGCRKCRYAAMVAEKASENPLSQNQELSAQLDDPRYSPSDLSLSSSKKVWWKCAESHRWEASVDSRIRSRCPYCTGYYPIVGETDLATLRPDIAAQWDDDLLKPTEVTIATAKKVRWKCENGHNWITSVHTRTTSRTKGSGCPYCPGSRGKNAKILAGVNDLATLFPDIAAELNTPNVSASELRPYMNTRLEWKCSKGHVWSTQVSSRTRQGSGCPSCALVRTSKVEKRLRNLVSDHENTDSTVLEDSHTLSVPFRRNKTMKVDVYCEWEGLPMVVEYDGSYWHHSEASFSRDTDKTSALLNHDYLVVRFRENKLAHLELDHPNLLQINVQYDKDEDTSLEEAISTMEEWLNSR